jgi:membrane-associated protease RseP (regulator of RpoE activity)
MTPVAWLLNNAVFLLLFGLIISLIYYNMGLEGLWNVTLAVVGIGVLIFVHELGHFLAAKWCDVHVQTFSIGFGPALPGCSFVRGETTYKIGAIPLGGYVNMVGEGPEADEDENYPRSFKNKSVGQRMLIISAGVIMNVLLGAVFFIIFYMGHGEYRPPGTVGAVEPASPLWQQGIPTGSVITRLDGIDHPYFDDLRIEVALSPAGEEIPFTFAAPEGSWKRTVNLLPRKGENDPNPVIGVAAPDQLKIYEAPKKQSAVAPPVVVGSAAAAARPLGLARGEVVLATTDPDHPDTLLDLPHDGEYFMNLAARVRKLAGRKLVLRVQPADKGTKPQEREVPAEGFTFGDAIVGTSRVPSTMASYDPMDLDELPKDPRKPDTDHRDPFEFHRRLVRLVGRPMVIQVRRANASADAPPIALFVPPAYHYTFGVQKEKDAAGRDKVTGRLQMQIGEVAGVRKHSPAERAGVQKGDKLLAVTMKDEAGKELLSRKSNELDAMRLPYDLYAAAATTAGRKKVILQVESSANGQPRTLPEVDWDESWDADEEMPFSWNAPTAIPQLGLAYRVTNQVLDPGSMSVPREGIEGAVYTVLAQLPFNPRSTHLRRGDQVRGVTFQDYGRPPERKLEWGSEVDLKSKRNGEDVYESWPHFQQIIDSADSKKVKFKVHRHGEDKPLTVELEAVEDPSWPAVDRGFARHLQPEYDTEKAQNFGQALVMGTRKTGRMIKALYLQLRSLVTGRIDAKQLGGPIALISQGSLFAGLGPWELLLFLGAMSINLAVVNFLPIPVLDGGHMVFLIYEKLRGRPPSESVRVAATWMGLAMILSLLVFVTWQDFFRYIWR